MRADLRPRPWLIGGAVALAMVVAVPAAKAVLHKLTAIGELTAVASGSPVETALGLQIGDPFVAMAVYDDALLSGVGSEAVDPAVNPGPSFALNVADVLLLDETDDIGFGFGFPEIEFFHDRFEVERPGLDMQRCH